MCVCVCVGVCVRAVVLFGGSSSFFVVVLRGVKRCGTPLILFVVVVVVGEDGVVGTARKSVRG